VLCWIICDVVEGVVWYGEFDVYDRVFGFEDVCAVVLWCCWCELWVDEVVDEWVVILFCDFVVEGVDVVDVVGVECFWCCVCVVCECLYWLVAVVVGVFVVVVCCF